MNPKVQNRWGVLLRTDCLLDGKREHLAGEPGLFRTRREARRWCAEHYGYIRSRPDLQAEPHGLKPAKVVRIRITYEVVE